jgi:hypothetical protein
VEEDREVRRIVEMALRQELKPEEERTDWSWPKEFGPFQIADRTRLRVLWLWRRGGQEHNKQYDYPIGNDEERVRARREALEALVDRVLREEERCCGQET